MQCISYNLEEHWKYTRTVMMGIYFEQKMLLMQGRFVQFRDFVLDLVPKPEHRGVFTTWLVLPGKSNVSG